MRRRRSDLKMIMRCCYAGPLDNGVSPSLYLSRLGDVRRSNCQSIILAFVCMIICMCKCMCVLEIWFGVFVVSVFVVRFFVFFNIRFGVEICTVRMRLQLSIFMGPSSSLVPSLELGLSHDAAAGVPGSAVKVLRVLYNGDCGWENVFDYLQLSNDRSRARNV